MEDSLNLERNINRKSELNLISCLKFKCHIFQKVVFLKIAFFFQKSNLFKMASCINRLKKVVIQGICEIIFHLEVGKSLGIFLVSISYQLIFGCSKET